MVKLRGWSRRDDKIAARWEYSEQVQNWLSPTIWHGQYKDRCSFAVVRDDQLLGRLSLSLYFLHSYTRIGLVLAPECMGKGIGRLALRRLLSEHQAQWYAEIHVNKVSSIKTFIDVGFNIHSRVGDWLIARRGSNSHPDFAAS